MRRKLTEDVVEGAMPHRTKQQVFLWDTSTAGLGLRVSSKGRKSWAFRFSLDGRDYRMTLGQYPELTLTRARQLAAEKRAHVDRGQDPRKALHSAGSGKGGAFTLGDLWRRFRDTHLHTLKEPNNPESALVPRRSAGHIRNCRRAFEDIIFPALGESTPIARLTWDAVSSWHQGMRGKPVEANRALASLRVALKKARRWDGWKAELTGPNPATDHEMHPEKKRMTARPYNDAELTAIGEALAAEPDPILRTAMTVYQLSGMRPDEVCRLRWADIEGGGVVRLPESKTGPRRAVLSQRAISLLEGLPRASEYVFPGRREGEPIGGHGRTHGLANMWRRIQGSTGIEARCYDARHTWVSVAGSLGIGEDIRHLLSGHVGNGASAHASYLHATPEMQPMADQVAERIASKLGLD